MATLRAVELFCGIGGVAAAIESSDRLRGMIEVVTAVDIDRQALDTYSLNFQHPTFARTIESLDADFFRSLRADLWWMSPPCQPFTRRGAGRDLDDPRCEALKNIIRLAADVQPDWLAMENVPPFQDSRARKLLVDTLQSAGYQIIERIICPTELGIPCRRSRYYLLAGRTPSRPIQCEWPTTPVKRRTLASFLDSKTEPDLQFEIGTHKRYRDAIDLVDPNDSAAIASCFTSAYGRSPVRSGSYIKEKDGTRRFSPAEILRLLGFPDSFHFPESMSRRRSYALAGNSLSVDVVRRWLEQIPLPPY